MESPIHSIDLLRVFAGSEVAEVHSVVRRACSPYKDVHGALILFENGCLGHLISNYTTDSRLQTLRDTWARHLGVPRRHQPGNGILRRQAARATRVRHGRAARGHPLLPRLHQRGPPRSRCPPPTSTRPIKTMELAEAIMAGLREDLPPA